MISDSERIVPSALLATADLPRSERPIAASPRPKINVEERDPRCAGCGGLHGSLGVRLNCMAREIKRLRAIIAGARETMEKL